MVNEANSGNRLMSSANSFLFVRAWNSETCGPMPVLSEAPTHAAPVRCSVVSPTGINHSLPKLPQHFVTLFTALEIMDAEVLCKLKSTVQMSGVRGLAGEQLIMHGFHS